MKNLKQKMAALALAAGLVLGVVVPAGAEYQYPGTTLPGTLFGPDAKRLCPGFRERAKWPEGGESIRFLKLNTKIVCFPDAQPYIDVRASRTLVPVRFVAENLGAQVDWDGEARAVTITKGGTVIRLVIGAAEASVNGKTVAFDAPATIHFDRTYVPLRFVSEAMGLKVEWDPQEHDVILSGDL